MKQKTLAGTLVTNDNARQGHVGHGEHAALAFWLASQQFTKIK